MGTFSGTCNILPYQAADIASKDTNRLAGQIAKALAVNSPFVNILDGGTFPAGFSDTQRSVIQEQSLTSDSLVTPTFVATKDQCGPGSITAETATTEYTYSLGTQRGRGPKICVKSAYSAFKGSYLMAEDALKKLLTQKTNADVRWNLLSYSGHKYVALNSGTYSFEQGLTGGESQISVAWANVASTNVGQLTFKAVHKLARHLHEVTLAEMFAEGTNTQHFKLIGGSDLIESFRAELGVKEVLIAETTGGFQTGRGALTSYRWEGPYRGISFGVDQRPLRASAFANGLLTYVEPFVSVATTKGNASRVNPAWNAAEFEVAFLIGARSFERLVPERYTGEGSFKFSPQVAIGDLSWHYVIDNDCNQYGDYGWHLYEITRAYRPVRPANVCPILFRRCPYDTGITSCSATGSLL
jgi:hypothetical protein